MGVHLPDLVVMVVVVVVVVCVYLCVCVCVCLCVCVSVCVCVCECIPTCALRSSAATAGDFSSAAAAAALCRATLVWSGVFPSSSCSAEEGGGTHAHTHEKTDVDCAWSEGEGARLLGAERAGRQADAPLHLDRRQHPGGVSQCHLHSECLQCGGPFALRRPQRARMRHSAPRECRKGIGEGGDLLCR